MYCAIVVCICTRVIVVLSLCVNVFVSAARSSSSLSFLLSKNYILCLWRLFWSLTKNSPNGKSTQNFLPIATFFCLVRYVVYTTFVSFFSIIPSTSTKGRSLFAFVSSRLVAIGAKRLLVLAGKEVERLYTLFARQKKKAPSFLPPLLLLLLLSLLLCDLFFFITTYELYSRGLRFFSFSFVLLLPSRGSNRRVVVVGRSRLLLLFLLLSFTHTRSLSSLLKNRHLLEASIDHFSKQKTHNLFSYIF